MVNKKTLIYKNLLFASYLTGKKAAGIAAAIASDTFFN
jgi:hypothetical protein